MPTPCTGQHALVHCTMHNLMTSLSSFLLQVLGMIDNPHYLYRMTVLVAIASLAPAVPHDCLCHNMLPVMVACARDKVRDACPQAVASASAGPNLLVMRKLSCAVLRLGQSSLCKGAFLKWQICLVLYAHTFACQIL